LQRRPRCGPKERLSKQKKEEGRIGATSVKASIVASEKAVEGAKGKKLNKNDKRRTASNPQKETGRKNPQDSDNPGKRGSSGNKSFTPETGYR